MVTGGGQEHGGGGAGHGAGIGHGGGGGGRHTGGGGGGIQEHPILQLPHELPQPHPPPPPKPNRKESTRNGDEKNKTRRIGSILFEEFTMKQ